MRTLHKLLATIVLTLCTASAALADPKGPEQPAAAPLSLKQRLQRGEVCTGTFLGILHGAPAAQYLRAQGLDYFILDMEHSVYDPTTVRDMILAARAVGIAPLIRVDEPGPQISRWLDAGAEGIVVPLVEDRRQAEKLVHYGRYQPLGKRGASSRSGHTAHGSVPYNASFMAERNRDVLLLVMLETKRGFEAADSILGTPGIDGAIVGTGDYSQDIGLVGQPKHPKVLKATQDLVKLAQKRGKIISVPIRDAADATEWVKNGLTMLTLLDYMFMGQGLKLTLDAIK
jgi:2-dehydro-3-deoxyglucarate aldolase/4-hydroxy-2-oxoheptanedioate aldolase